MHLLIPEQLRTLNFKISLSKKQSDEISCSLFDKDIFDLINQDLIDYYNTPGKISNLLKLSKEKEIDLKNLSLKDLVSLLINKSYYKEDDNIKNLMYELVELFLIKKISLDYLNLSNYFLNKINEYKKFNLDDESLFLEINSKLLNG